MNKFEKLSQNSTLIKQLGVSQTEFKTYLQLLSLGPCTKTDFANKFKVPRTTVFANIEKLIEKGLVSQVSKNNRNIVIAENPKKLELLALKRQMELEDELSQAKGSGKELLSLIGKISHTIPQSEKEDENIVKYYLGTAGFRTAWQRALENAENEILLLANMKTWTEFYSNKEEEKSLEEREKRKIRLRVLAVNNSSAQNYQANDEKFYRTTKILPKQFEFQPCFVISGGEVTIVNYSPSYLVTAITINDPDVVEFYKLLFSFYGK